MNGEDEAFAAAASGDVTKWPFSEIGKRDMTEAFASITSPAGNSLLHIAARSGKEEMTGIMASKFPFMMTMENSKGDTALHVATKAGMIATVKKLVNCAEADSNNTLLKMKNGRGNTALHEALISLKAIIDDKKSHGAAAAAKKALKIDNFLSISRCLVSADQNTSYMQNNSGDSPLCLAVATGNDVILKYILSALPEGDDCFTKLEGKSPVQVAIEKKRLDLLNIMEKQQPALLLVRDKEGNTPMHWAASMGYKEGVTHLYDKDRKNALQRNNEGFYPLHLACKKNRVGILDMLLKKKWPEPIELYNNKGQNILHIAAKKGRVLAVRRILETPDHDKFVNERDDDGNTPMHLAALYGHVIVVGDLLFRNPANLNIVNNANLTAYDIAEQQCEKLNPEFSGEKDDRKHDDKDSFKSEHVTVHKNGMQSQLKIDPLKKTELEPEPYIYPAMMTLSLLFFMHNINIFFAGGTFIESLKNVLKNLKLKSQKSLKKEDVYNRVTVLLVVATLIAGAAFAASTQISSGDSDDEGGGAPPPVSPGGGAPAPQPQKHARHVLALRFFTVPNTIAMYTSITAAIILCWAQLQDVLLASLDVWLASVLVGAALYTLCIAFMATVYMLWDLGDKFIWAMIGIQGLLLCFLAVRSVQLFVPFAMKQLFILFVYGYHSLIYYFLYSLYLSCRQRWCCRCCFTILKQMD